MIFVEGKPDRVLLKSIGISVHLIRVEGSKGNVCNSLKKNRNVKGMVDEDPDQAQPSYISQLKEVNKDHNLIEYEDKTNSNKLIVVRPHLERWIVWAMDKAQIDLATFFLPTTSRELKKVINRRLDKFEKLVSDNSEIKALLRLKEFINN